MRIKCQIEILNRCAASQGLRGGCGKSAQATLFLARKPGDIVFLIFCTAKDKQGTKYRVNKNIQQIFGKFVSDGKATIRLKEPVVDMCISKADPVELKRILKAIKSAHLGETLSGQSILSSMAPAKTKHVEKPKTKLVVTSRKDYPVTSSFPLMLERLHIHDCNLARLDTRLFNLKHLYLLDVSSNKIKTLPTALSQMESLCELNVAKNEISEIPAELCQPQAPWCKTLKSLNLCNNKLTCLPRNFHNFFNLWQLQLCNNSITKLPEQLGKLHNLRRLAASNNSIKYLPLSFTMLHLETLDLFMNPFVNDTQLPSNDVVCCSLKIPSLRELSGRIIRKHQIFYDNYEYVPYLLIQYLNCSRQCQCGNFCFETRIRFLMQFDLSRICQNLISLDHTGQTHAPVDAVLCSCNCYRRYQSHGIIMQ